MKRLVVGVLILTVLAAAIAYWHVVDQIETRLEALAGLVAPVGRLSWSGIRIDPRGRASIIGLRFQSHDNRDRISVERLNVDAGGLAALLRLDRSLESGRLPATLNVAAYGLNLPVNQQIDDWLGALLPPQPFIAAGCSPVDPLRYRSLGELGWWDLTIDARFGFRHLENEERLELTSGLRVNQLGEIRLSANLVVPAAGLAGPAGNEPVAGNVALQRAQVTMINRGFYERLIENCTNRTGLTPDQFLSVHLESWEVQWQALGLQPGRLVLAGYRHFLGQPESLSVALDPETAADLTELSPMTGPLWQRLEPRFSVNGGTEVDVSFYTIAPAPAPASAPAESDQPVGPTAGASIFEPAEESSSSSIPGRTFGPMPQWQSIDLDRASEHIGARIRLELTDGTRYSGHLVGIDGDNLQISIRSRLGQIVRPLARAEIARAEIRP